ncbi:MAG: transglutaminase domain-containing protein [Promethearchaeota archaeon]|nr:MAG: transglutaminase domain-containing protein [Candidatus Lokiarchaeota archaeon]
MKVLVKYSNKISLLKGRINSGYIRWALLGFSNHHIDSKIVDINPISQVRVQGEEKNTFAFIKLPKLSAGDEFMFTAKILYNTMHLKIPLIDFSFSEFPEQVVKKYCTYSKYWQILNPRIKEIVNKLKKKSGDNVKEYLKKVFNFVENKIELRKDMKMRLGAINVINKGFGDCDEFSDLFITLLRAAKIPARRVVGIFVSEQGLKHEFHAWSEVFIPHYNTFIPYDVALGFFAEITSLHLVRLKMLQSDQPRFVYVKFKGTSNVALDSIENDLEEIKTIN